MSDKLVPWFFALAIPVAAFTVNIVVMLVIENDWYSSLEHEFGILTEFQREQLALNVVCFESELGNIAREWCRDYDWLWLLNFGAVITALLSAGSLVAITVAGRVGAINRDLLLRIFRPGLYITFLGLIVLILANAALAITSVYFAMSEFLGIISPWLLLIVSLAAVGAVLTLLGSLFEIPKTLTADVMGISVSRESAPELWDLIYAISNRLGAHPPGSIVVGLDPTFFVVDTHVRTFTGTLRGETLFVSLPLARLLNQNEFTAVLAHELAHFSGKDTRYSREFAPIYRGVESSIRVLAESTKQSLGMIVILPALAILNYYLDSFRHSERSIGREREFEADRVAALLTHPQTLATALVKISTLARLWEKVLLRMAEPNERLTANASIEFVQLCNEVSLAEAQLEMTNDHVPHPMDSHPSLSDRLRALGLSQQDTKDTIEIANENHAATLIPRHEEIERELTNHWAALVRSIY